MKAIVGQSEDTLEENAVSEIVEQIGRQYGEEIPDAGILFCSIDYDQQKLVNLFNEAFPALELIGCTTDGELSSNLGFTEDSVVFMALASDRVEVRAGMGSHVATQGEQAGEQAALSALHALERCKDRQQFAVIFSDPISAGISGVDKGIKKVLGENFPVFGGVAAAHSKKRKTFQFYKTGVYSDSVVLLLFAGPVTFSFGIAGGHSPLGQKMEVTEHKGNVLYKIGEMRAYDYFFKYIGDRDLFMNYCLAVFEDDSDNYFVLSAPISDPEKGSVTLNGILPPRAIVQIGTANKDVVLSSCEDSVGDSLGSFSGTPELALFFSCAGRKMIMGTKISMECAVVEQKIPSLPFCGFYCYGEFGPLVSGAPFRFHGTTFVSLLIGEDYGV